MAMQWTDRDVLDLSRAFQPVCVLSAAVELGVFDALADAPLTVIELAAAIESDPRATTMLADALVAMGLLAREADRYALGSGVTNCLTEQGSAGCTATIRHLANCMRSWTQLAHVVRTGAPAERCPSVRGPEADLEAFIEAMNEICRDMAPQLVVAIGPPEFDHLLDLGGGPATWTIAFLQAVPGARATLFDRPEVIPIARAHLQAAGLSDRTELVAGDFYVDGPLPAGADLAWVSAIVHQNSRRQNRDLFAKVHAALIGGGRIMIRDVVMDASHIEPAAGALFAINMLVNTPAGGTYSFDQLSEDLAASGFVDPQLLYRGEFMESVVQAIKPA